MGCAKGGFPRCPGGWELQCKDGTHLTPEYGMRHYIQYGFTGCMCPDGIMPK